MSGELPPPISNTRTADPSDGVGPLPRLPDVVLATPAPAGGSFAAATLPTVRVGGSTRRRTKGGVRRFVRWTVVLGSLGGLAYGGIVYGPELIARARGTYIDEPTVALAFPTPSLTPAVVRTATYNVEHYTEAGALEEFTVTADFESGISLVTVDSSGGIGMEVLSVLDDSFIRRDNEPLWWSLPRGTFPVDPWQEKSRWVRTLDEVIPADLRATATIKRATESSVGDVPTTRLLVSVDPQRLAPPPPPPPVAASSVAEVDAPPPPLLPPVPLPPGMRLRPEADLDAFIDIELWVDESGLVRKLILPEELGGETITITSASADPFTPVYPAADEVRPMSADALFNLAP